MTGRVDENRIAVDPDALQTVPELRDQRRENLVRHLGMKQQAVSLVAMAARPRPVAGRRCRYASAPRRTPAAVRAAGDPPRPPRPASRDTILSRASRCDRPSRPGPWRGADCRDICRGSACSRAGRLRSGGARRAGRDSGRADRRSADHPSRPVRRRRGSTREAAGRRKPAHIARRAPPTRAHRRSRPATPSDGSAGQLFLPLLSHYPEIVVYRPPHDGKAAPSTIAAAIKAPACTPNATP
jgi:hypothetical protein